MNDSTPMQKLIEWLETEAGQLSSGGNTLGENHEYMAYKAAITKAKSLLPTDQAAPKRDEEIEQMAISKGICTPYGKPNPETYSFIKGYKAALQLEKEPEDRWIAVSERKPEVGQLVLIYEPCYDRSHPECDIYATTFYSGPKPKKDCYHYEWPDGQDEQPGSYSPTHWQPLPSAPKTITEK